MRGQRDSLFLVILAITAAPTFAQNVPITVGPDNGTTQPAASIPDFSGFWGHPYWPGFEQPLSGPGPVVNKFRRRQNLDADGGASRPTTPRSQAIRSG
jgi:hypothetical protein